ncbi:MAG TPA: energy transducer TonB [Steroidobacteraceae bacterium]|nr:energy transducer TonB [Steroidobacteraceae bacterium]
MRHRESGDIACWLVRHAAHHSPSDLASRLEEEWLADLSARRGVASRLRFGLGCWWAGRIIAHEHGAACAAPVSAASGHRLLLLNVHLDPSRWSRTTAVVIAVICIHAVLVYAFVTGLAQRVVAIMSPPTIATLTQHTPTHEPPPPLPQPRTVPAEPDDPIPLPIVNTSDDSAAIHLVSPPPRPTVSAVPAAPPPVTRVLGGPGAGFPNTDDYYPPAARRLGEAGTTVVQVCVDTGGRLTAAPLVVRSSGHANIDAGSLNLARAGSGHYRPTTENGRPVSSCYAYRVTFRFKD